MITELKKITKTILEDYPSTRTDKGNGDFLNIASRLMFKDKQIDFNVFKNESWSRSRRLVLTENPHLDERTYRTREAEMQVIREVA